MRHCLSFALAAVLLPSLATALEVPAGTTCVLPTAAATDEIILAGTLDLGRITGDLPAAAIRARAGNGVATIALPAGTDGPRSVRMDGTLEVGRYAPYTTVAITGDPSGRLELREVVSTQPGAVLKSDGPAVTVATARSVAIGGSAAGCTLGTYSGPWLQKSGNGSWTITGDNHTEAWNTAVAGGRLALARGASLGRGPLAVAGGATLALPGWPAGTAPVLPNPVNLADGATIDLADGVIGETRLARLTGPGGGNETIRLDLGAQGPDHLVLDAVGPTPAIRGRIEFNPVGRLAPGTWTFVSLAGPGTLMEHHFGFAFTGEPADHRNIVYTSRADGCDLTIKVVEERGEWRAMTVTVSRP